MLAAGLGAGKGGGPALEISWMMPQQNHGGGQGRILPSTPSRTVLPLTLAVAGRCLGSDTSQFCMDICNVTEATDKRRALGTT